MPRRPNHKKIERLLTGPLAPTPKVVLCYLSVSCGSKTFCWPSFNNMVRDLHVSKYVIARQIKYLQDRGLIYRFLRAGWRSRITFINPTHPYWSIKSEDRSVSVDFKPTPELIEEARKLQKESTEVQLESLVDPESTLSSIQDTIRLMLSEEEMSPEDT